MALSKTDEATIQSIWSSQWFGGHKHLLLAVMQLPEHAQVAVQQETVVGYHLNRVWLCMPALFKAEKHIHIASASILSYFLQLHDKNSPIFPLPARDAVARDSHSNTAAAIFCHSLVPHHKPALCTQTCLYLL